MLQSTEFNTLINATSRVLSEELNNEVDFLDDNEDDEYEFDEYNFEK